MWKPIILALIVAVAGQRSKGLVGKYFNTQSFSRPDYFWKIDSQINFGTDVWGLKGPRTAFDKFGVQWSGFIAAVDTVVMADCDDRVEVAVGGKVILSSWRIPYTTFRPVASGLPAGKLEVKYVENYGSAHCRLLRHKTANTEALKTQALADLDREYAQGDYLGYILTNFEAIPPSFFEYDVTPTNTPNGPFPLLRYNSQTDKDTQFRKTWYTLAVVTDLQLTETSYSLGTSLPSCLSLTNPTTATTQCVVPCRAFDYVYSSSNNNADLALDNVMIKLTMGDYVDYFRPKQGWSLCDMLNKQESHEWAPTEDGPWYSVDFNRNGVGGSGEDWPSVNTFADNRRVINFWRYGWGKGSCCLNTVDNSAWRKRWWERPRGDVNKGFTIQVRFHPRTDIKPLAADSYNTVTEKIGADNWIVYAQVPDSLKLENRFYDSKKGESDPFWGWNTAYIHTNKHAAFIRNCADFNAWGDKVDLVLRLGKHRWNYTTGVATWSSGPVGDASDGKGLVVYFRPNPGLKLCDMLNSTNNHLWSLDGLTYYTPIYTDDKRFRGGSQWGYPTKRLEGIAQFGSLNHLPFWTGEYAAYGRYDAADAEGWGHSFQMLVRSITDRDATRPLVATAWPAKQAVNALLHLGAVDERISVNTQRDVWNDRVLERKFLEKEGTNATFRVAEGQVETYGNVSYKWQPIRNYFWPPVFGTSTNDDSDNYWVRFFSLCVKPSQAGAWSMTIFVDDMVRLYQDGFVIQSYINYKDTEQDVTLKPVEAGKWTQFIFKLYDGGWSSGLSVKFSIPVDWKTTGTC